MPTRTRPRIVIAGQVPPPFGGQNVMIARLLEDLSRCPAASTQALPFFFTREFKDARKGGISKFIELVKVIGRLLKLRLQGPIDLLVYPPGGPQNIPLIRDLFLLPWILLFSHKVILHFHAGGIADRLQTGGVVPTLAAFLYRHCAAAIVMTRFNRRDPEACGMTEIHVIPHQLEDEYDPAFITRNPCDNPVLGSFTFLYMGHLCHDKGTPQLLQAFAMLLRNRPPDGNVLILELAGEPLPPYSLKQLESAIDHLGLKDHVRLPGVLHGNAKKAAFGRANLFIFPSIAPYESFGLVMVEAMMWGLPVLASDWRGNRDVLHNHELLFPAGTSFNSELSQALAGALARRSNWGSWGLSNRKRYEESFKSQEPPGSLSAFLLKRVLL